jgi:hypothetical protein
MVGILNRMNAGPWLMGARDLRSVVRGSKRPLHSLAILSGQLLRSANGILELPEIEYHLTTPKIPSEEIRETVATARFPEVDLDQLPASGGSQARSGEISVNRKGFARRANLPHPYATEGSWGRIGGRPR